MLELRILVDNIDYDSIAEYLIPVVAEKLRREMASRPVSSLQLILTVSIGVAEYMSEDTLESWLKRADDALYQAKKSGRNKVVLF